MYSEFGRVRSFGSNRGAGDGEEDVSDSGLLRGEVSTLTVTLYGWYGEARFVGERATPPWE